MCDMCTHFMHASECKYWQAVAEMHWQALADMFVAMKVCLRNDG
jgi:hypothetical protein